MLNRKASKTYDLPWSNKLLEKLHQYITKHGLGPKTPMLTLDLKPDIFLKHYYHKDTLLAFCRTHHLPTSGLKQALTTRIAAFLKTGIINYEKGSNKVAAPPDSQSGLTINKQVIHYKSDPATRAFLASHIPNFKGFSASVQQWIKQRLSKGEVFTYGDIIKAHQAFLAQKAKRKLNREPVKVVHASCQLNQFLADYHQDPDYKPHAAKYAWELVRESAGDKTYARYKEAIKSIIQQLSK